MGKAHPRFTLSFNAKLTLIVLALLVASLVAMAGFLYTNLYSVYERNAYEALEKQIIQTAETIDNFFNAIDMLAVYHFADPSINTLIEAGPDGKTRQKKIEELGQKYEANNTKLGYGMTATFSLMQSMYIFVDEYSYLRLPFSRKADQENIGVYREARRENKSGPYLISPTTAKPYLYIVRNVYNLPTESSPLTLVTNIFETALSNCYVNFLQTKGAIAMVLDQDGIIFSQRDKKDLGMQAPPGIVANIGNGNVFEAEIDGKHYFMMLKEVAWGKLVFAAGIPRETVFENLSVNMRNFSLLSALIAFLCIGVSIFTVQLSMRFIKDFTKSMELVAQGNLDVQMRSYKDHDLQLMSQTFNEMTSKIKRLIDEVYQGQLLLNETEIKFLQSQMNPHFLFNVLTAIRTKARNANDKEIYQMMGALSDLLRAGIYTDNTRMVTLREEFDFVEKYLYLQKTRFGDHLQYHVCVPDKCIEACKIPKLCIVAIVENAVVHGIEEKIDAGSIRISARLDGSDIRIHIEDNGVGFDMAKLDFTGSVESTIPSGNHNQIGLKNTDRRLRLIYGEQYGISIQSAIGIGTGVTVAIPCVKEGSSPYV
ncbi:MAG TPA: histidine kinase [Feifaniaceae bacterium]|nr:histidine kinase [Feifaniaceae bacterium]